MRLDYVHNDQPVTLDLQPDGDGWRVRLPDGTERRIEARRDSGGLLTIRTDGRVFRAAAERVGAAVHVSYNGRVYAFEPPTAKRAGAKHTSGTLEAPMPGVVADVLVKEGQPVEAYQPLAVVEAMKVMATLEAPFKGTVVKVGVEKGQRVAQGDLIVEVEPVEESGGE